MKTSDFGLSKPAYEKLSKLLKSVEQFRSVKIFGSRALGTFKEGSDIDIAVYGNDINRHLIRKCKIDYENLNLPYQLDLIHYESIDNPELKRHIDEFGQDLL